MTATDGKGTGIDGFSELLGIEYPKSVPGEAHGRVAVTDALRQPFGIVHGGVYAALAESVCSAATSAAVAAKGMIAMGQSSDAFFLRPIDSGHVNGVARARHTGRTT